MKLKWISLDGDTLGQVARLINIQALGDSYMIREKLERDDLNERREAGKGLGHLDVVIDHRLDKVVALVDDGEDATMTTDDFLEVGDDLLITLVVVGQEDYGHLFVNQGNRAVLHFGSRIAFGMDIGDLFEFQGSFKSHRIIESSS